jgi:hypothetical protein
LDANLDLYILRLDQKDAKPKNITEDNKANDFNRVQLVILQAFSRCFAGKKERF